MQLPNIIPNHENALNYNYACIVIAYCDVLLVRGTQSPAADHSSLVPGDYPVTLPTMLTPHQKLSPVICYMHLKRLGQSLVYD